MSHIPREAADAGLPADVDGGSRSRFPLLRRQDLDAAGQAAYDRGSRPGLIAGLKGPAGIQLYSTKTAPHLSALNNYLRNEAGLSPREREVAILATAREMDSQFEWVAHEGEALRCGVPRDVVEAIKHRRSLDGLPVQDALVIELGRALWRDHRVAPGLYARLESVYGKHRLLDLVLLMGTYASTAAMLALVDMQLPLGSHSCFPRKP